MVNLLQEPVYLLSGTNFPVSAIFPTAVAAAATLIPLTAGMDAMRQVLFRTPGCSRVGRGGGAGGAGGGVPLRRAVAAALPRTPRPRRGEADGAVAVTEKNLSPSPPVRREGWGEVSSCSRELFPRSPRRSVVARISRLTSDPSRRRAIMSRFPVRGRRLFAVVIPALLVAVLIGCGRQEAEWPLAKRPIALKRPRWKRIAPQNWPPKSGSGSSRSCRRSRSPSQDRSTNGSRRTTSASRT